MKAGFSFLELIIGLFISSILMIALYSGFFVTGSVVKTAETVIGIDMHLAIIAHQLENDLSGVFIPLEIKETATTADANEQKAPASQKTTEESSQKTTKDIFLSTNKDTVLQKLTFITNNPLQIYSKEGPKPRIVRVVYSLIPSEDKTSFSLMRQESTNLDLKAFETKGQQEIRKYSLAANIKSMHVEYLYPEQVKEEAKKDKEQQPITYKAEKEWGKTSTEKGKQGPPKIPQFITITVELWDPQHRQSRTFVLHYTVAAFKSATTKQKKQIKPPQAAKPSTTPPTNTPQPKVG